MGMLSTVTVCISYSGFNKSRSLSTIKTSSSYVLVTTAGMTMMKMAVLLLLLLMLIVSFGQIKSGRTAYPLVHELSLPIFTHKRSKMLHRNGVAKEKSPVGSVQNNIHPPCASAMLVEYSRFQEISR